MQYTNEAEARCDMSICKHMQARAMLSDIHAVFLLLLAWTCSYALVRHMSRPHCNTRSRACIELACKGGNASAI